MSCKDKYIHLTRTGSCFLTWFFLPQPCWRSFWNCLEFRGPWREFWLLQVRTSRSRKCVDLRQQKLPSGTLESLAISGWQFCSFFFLKTRYFSELILTLQIIILLSLHWVYSVHWTLPCYWNIWHLDLKTRLYLRVETG